MWGTNGGNDNEVLEEHGSEYRGANNNTAGVRNRSPEAGSEQTKPRKNEGWRRANGEMIKNHTLAQRRSDDIQGGGDSEEEEIECHRKRTRKKVSRKKVL